MADPKELIDRTVKITQGPYKSHIGIVKDATESTARVELHSKCQTISVDRSRIAVMGGPSNGPLRTYNKSPPHEVSSMVAKRRPSSGPMPKRRATGKDPGEEKKKELTLVDGKVYYGDTPVEVDGACSHCGLDPRNAPLCSEGVPKKRRKGNPR